MRSRAGFTLIETVIGIGVVMFVVGGIIFAVNPVKYSAKFRNAQRIANAQAILNAVQQKLVADGGIFTCKSGRLPWGARMENPKAVTEPNYNMAPCLVPDYMGLLPFDPVSGHWTSINDFSTGYQIGYNPTSGQVTVLAPYADPPELINVTR